MLYPGNILVLLRSPRDDIEHVRIVLSLSRDGETTHKFKKCSFFTGPGAYLGVVIQSRRLEIVPHKTDAIKE